MYQNWLKPIDDPSLNPRLFKSDSIGSQIIAYRQGEAFPDFEVAKIVIIGLNTTIADKVRNVFYRYQQNFPKGTIIDLGNAANESIPFIQPVLEDLFANNYLVILLGQQRASAITQFLAHRKNNRKINVLCIDDKIRLSAPSIQKDDYLNEIINTNFLQYLSIIGVQAHFLSAKNVDFFDKEGYEYVRLGKAKSNLEDQEPLIREADTLMIQLSALKSAEAPAQLDPTPSGFVIEEICQLVRYAGLNERLSSIGFYGWDEAIEDNQQSAHCVAQMVWYFMDGFMNRISDYPVSTEGMVEYIVDVKKYGYRISFWKSTKTGRWWMQLPLSEKDKTTKQQLIPCSYQDYIAASNQDLPERLFKKLY